YRLTCRQKAPESTAQSSQRQRALAMALLDEQSLVGFEEVELADQPQQSRAVAVVDDRQHAELLRDHTVGDGAQRLVRSGDQRQARELAGQRISLLGLSREHVRERERTDQLACGPKHGIEPLA